MVRHCTCCGKPFEPRPQVPDQAFCSSPNCQRARKRQWQRAKLQSDPNQDTSDGTTLSSDVHGIGAHTYGIAHQPIFLC